MKGNSFNKNVTTRNETKRGTLKAKEDSMALYFEQHSWRVDSRSLRKTGKSRTFGKEESLLHENPTTESFPLGLGKAKELARILSARLTAY